MKKILAAIAACAMSAAMLGITASAAGETAAESEITIPEETTEITVPEATDVTTESETTTVAEETTAATEAENASNPKTGNAPIALAVIPVALAAAAVVAKKAK